MSNAIGREESNGMFYRKTFCNKIILWNGNVRITRLCLK